ncbi:hypothetical protein [Halovivax cerinus]|uniref:Uncharacterized protein n=1 Tax=Halovivax cerinus TaxID=1487865 RepID=A0ABD5NL44_9EURY|nr:hypothetical protein [Halovivax cerinus]
MADALTCPECGEGLEGNLGRVPAFANGDAVRLALECPGCAAMLELAGAGPSIATAEAR